VIAWAEFERTPTRPILEHQCAPALGEIASHTEQPGCWARRFPIPVAGRTLLGLPGSKDGGAGAYDHLSDAIVKRVEWMIELREFRGPAGTGANEGHLELVSALFAFLGQGQSITSHFDKRGAAACLQTLCFHMELLFRLDIFSPLWPNRSSTACRTSGHISDIW
jgi:hypothetical protein